MIDWNMLQRFADIGASKFRRHYLYEDVHQEVLFDQWRKIEEDPDIDHPLLVWFARSQSVRHFNSIQGDPRSKRGRRAMHRNTNSYDGKPMLQDRVAELGATDIQTVSVADEYGLVGTEALVANLLSQGVLKVDIARHMGCSRTQITRVCRLIATQIEVAA